MDKIKSGILMLSVQVLLIKYNNHLREIKTEKELSALSNNSGCDTGRHTFSKYDNSSALYLSFFLKSYTISLLAVIMKLNLLLSGSLWESLWAHDQPNIVQEPCSHGTKGQHHG